jgi:hypothetical protein
MRSSPAKLTAITSGIASRTVSAYPRKVAHATAKKPGLGGGAGGAQVGAVAIGLMGEA